MNTENALEMELRQSKRLKKVEKKETDDTALDNHRKSKRTFQENIVQKKQTRQKKTKPNTQEKLLEQAGKDSNIIDDKDIPKEDADDENTETSKQPSKRQLKKEKLVHMETEKRHTRKISAMQRAMSYVSKWKHSRSEWKFEKIRQIWLIDNLLDKNSIPEAMFPIVLEYFEGCKGMARELLLKKGMDIIRKAEEEEDDDSRNEIMESVAFKRARELLQALPTDR